MVLRIKYKNRLLGVSLTREMIVILGNFVTVDVLISVNADAILLLMYGAFMGVDFIFY